MCQTVVIWMSCLKQMRDNFQRSTQHIFEISCHFSNTELLKVTAQINVDDLFTQESATFYQRTMTMWPKRDCFNARQTIRASTIARRQSHAISHLP